MSRWFRLDPRDDRYNNFLFREGIPVRPRKTYAEITCPSCGKLDEYAALSIPLEKDVFYRSNFDLSCSFDGIYCVSYKFFEVFKRYKLGGVDFVPINRSGFYMIVPVNIADINMVISGFEYYGGQCETCHRW
jgi:hypothetical protein